MRGYLLFCLLFGLAQPYASAQSIIRFSLGTPEGYSEGASTIKEVRRVYPEREYHWLKGGELHATQGGYAGRLLSGGYIAYYPNGQLREAGLYWRGLKDGEWKQWNAEGHLQQLQRWSKGRREGLSLIFDAEGQPLRSERYRHGVLKRIDEMDKDPLKPKVKHEHKRKDSEQGQSTNGADPKDKKAMKAEKASAKEQARAARKEKKECAAEEKRNRKQSKKSDTEEVH